ncbi:nitric-oxide reductase [Agrilactobacillus composti DSM 18527 = JCM 14202]|uniref:Nitric-oxide reductase n=1 Tax=Agrilactobacillus composti DSM 18527 = JCM 14202 TaxID=1423734 RepID=X0PSY2_9LACO|nr:cbb3-type cytochrome c oxidase subunit I [Agrilactobacillus composti]KRM34979.1 nitric-oxide reductase [Agrilactobacillus composti DSM 18527 = JCM 14202]GAF41052.1 nitric-oxide reductase, quinol-dependent [Agrilactobacillus composti DSM 18527 = JCM 14202]
MRTSKPYARLTKILITVLIVVFSILIAGGFLIFKNEAPRPAKIVNTNGNTLVSHKTLLSGQAVYERYGLTDYGTYLGNGSYLGPDYTAQALHVYLKGMHRYYAQTKYHKAWGDLSDLQQEGIKGVVKKEIKVNRYSQKADTLTLSPAQAAGFTYLQRYYRREFINNPRQAGLPENMIKNNTGAYMVRGNKVDQLSSFFFWGAWMASTNRPGQNFSYTNNWPYDLDAGNTMPAEAMIWTAISVAILVAGVGVIIWVQRRYNFDMEFAYGKNKPPRIDPDLPISDSQRKTGKFFLLVMVLFLVQILLGELMAHYYVENSFFGIPLQNIWPFNLAKTWHLQLVIFWVATAWLATGIYVVPRIRGREPKHQGALVNTLFYGLLVVVAGSMLGEWGDILGFVKKGWWLIGHFGWEYLEMGKAWQWLFIVAMLLWIVILMRGFIPAIRHKGEAGTSTDRTRLTTLLFLGAIAIPAFYLASLFILPNSHVTFADYWRWWIVHLWVEGIFESFAVILIGWLMVDMKLTTSKSTIRALYFQLTLLLGAGVVGMGHHYWWQGDHNIWLSLGACFSALEVIPLCLLIWEAWTHYKVYKESQLEFPYKGTFMFLAATGIWNAIGAGALGFLINAPAINYFEHGTQWTSAHAHGSMAGVYGMFSIAIMLYTLRNISKKEIWTAKLEKWLKRACWLLNIGLAGMTFITLMPVGTLQLKDALTNGYWHARLLSFYHGSTVATLLWLRIIPDLIFTAGVVVLLVVVYKIVRNLKPAQNKAMADSHQEWDQN